MRILPLALSAYCAVAAAAPGQIRVTPLLPLEGQTREPSLSPDGTTIAFDWCKPDYSCGIYTRPLGGGAVRLVAGFNDKEGLPFSPRWSPDGTRIAFTRMLSHFDNHLRIRDLSGNEERDLGTVCDRAADSSWSPDGRFLVASVYSEDPPRSFECRIALFSASTGKRIRDLTERGYASALSPDGRQLAYADGNELILLNLTSEHTPRTPGVRIAHEPREISLITWRPDGKQILYQVWGDAPYLRLVAVGRTAGPRTVRGPVGQLAITQVLADGTALATETTQTDLLWRADLSGRAPVQLQTVSNPDCSSGFPTCSPDGRLRAFITAPTGISQIWLANGDGSNARPLVRNIPGFSNPDDEGFPSLAGWSPDGQWIAFTVRPRRGNADIRTDLYVVSPSGGLPRRLGIAAYGLDMPTWDRDGKALYAAQGWSPDDPVNDDKSPIVKITVADGRITPVGANGMWPLVSPDGKFVYFFSTPRPKLFRIAIGSNLPEQLWDRQNLDWFNATVGAHDLYLFEQPPRDTKSSYKLIRFDPTSRQATPLADITFSPRSAWLSRDERFLYFQQSEDPTQRVVRVDGIF